MTKKLLVLVLSLSLVLGCATGVFAKPDKEKNKGYHHSLESVGITEEAYLSMPEEKQEMYKNLEVTNVTSATKYFKITKSNDINGITSMSAPSDSSSALEISKEQFLFEVQADLDIQFISTMSIAEDFDTDSESWVTFTTRLAETSWSDEWVLSNDVTYIKSNGFLQPINTHVIGLGTNANFSVIKDSEYLKHDYTLYSLDLGIYTEGLYDYYWTANKKQNVGYAYYFDIAESQINNKAFMALMITPNVSTTSLVDGFGHYAKYTKSVTPSLSFSTSGASLSISPTTSLTEADNTHVQLIK